MNSISKVIFVVIAMAVINTMTGCSTLLNFERPKSEQVMLGKTTFSEVKKQLGRPMGANDSKFQSNGETFTVKTYLFGYGQSPLHISYTHRLRYMVDEDDVIVGEDYLSSMPEDSTKFPLDKETVAKIVRGVSTKADVITLLGKPSGKFIYPITQNEGDTVMIYTYGEEWFPVSHYQEYRVIVTLNSNDVVTFVSYTINGEQQL